METLFTAQSGSNGKFETFVANGLVSKGFDGAKMEMDGQFQPIVVVPVDGKTVCAEVWINGTWEVFVYDTPDGEDWFDVATNGDGDATTIVDSTLDEDANVIEVEKWLVSILRECKDL